MIQIKYPETSLLVVHRYNSLLLLVKNQAHIDFVHETDDDLAHESTNLDAFHTSCFALKSFQVQTITQSPYLNPLLFEPMTSYRPEAYFHLQTNLQEKLYHRYVYRTSRHPIQKVQRLAFALLWQYVQFSLR